MGALGFSAAPAQERIAIARNHPDTSIAAGWSRAPDDLPLHMIAVLALRHEQEMQALKDALQDPRSPQYHQWLGRAQFMRRFGPTQEQMNSVVSWLVANHFKVGRTDLGTREIHFSGSAATAERAFSVAIVSRAGAYANLDDPQLPPSIAAGVAAIMGLSRFSPDPQRRPRESAVMSPQFEIGKKIHFSPQDFWTYYDQSPPTTPGNNAGTGAGDCIGLLEHADTVPAAVAAFDTQFSLPAVNLTVVPTDPAQPLPQPSDNESILDVDWAHAVAPGTPVVLYVANDPTSPQPQFDALSLAVERDTCGVISSSIDDTGALCPDVAQIEAFAGVDAQAVMQGQTLFHSSGDYGSFYPCGQPAATPGATGLQPSVQESSASADVTVVGGTQFDPVYDSSGVNTSVLAPGLEQVWNEYPPLNPVPTPTPSPQKGASGGGISVVFPKPPWQIGLVPFGLSAAQFTKRGLPDVAAVASPNQPGLWIATTNEIQGCPGGAPICYVGDGGTSASSPIWAGISRLIAQRLGSHRLGNINPQLYAIAVPGGPLVDVSQLGQNCPFFNCTVFPGYQVGPGYDLATGLGSPDINKLIGAFATPTPSATATATPTSTPTASASPTPSMTPSAAVSATPGPSPTSTPAPAALITSSNIDVIGFAGQTIAAGSLKLNNTSGMAESVGAVTLSVSNPALFSSLALSASTSAGATQTAAPGALSGTITFTFSPALSVPAGGSAGFALRATMVSSRISGRLGLAGMVSYGGNNPGGASMAIILGLINLGAVAIPGCRRLRIRLMAAALLLFAAAQAGCGGNGGVAVLGTSRQSAPSGGVAVSTARGPAAVAGLPATISTIGLAR